MSLTYDNYGRRSIMTDGTGTQSYTYDDNDAPLSVQTTYTGLSPKTISYTYYPDGSRETMSVPDGSFSYTYDADGRMTGLTALGETSSWQYLDNGWLWKQVLGDGAVTTYAYNALGQTTDLVNRAAGGALLSEFATPNQGGYDGAGNRTALAVTLPAAPAGYSGLTAYGYDAKDQLTQEQSTRLSGYTQGFGYDAAGNATTFRGASRAFNANNQHTANTYDGDGNPTTYQGQSLSFDPENRVTAFGSALSAGYTGDGLRAWKQSGGGGKTYFLYDGETPVVEVDATGTVTAVNTVGADGLLSRWSRFHFVPASPPPPEMAMPADPPPVDLFYAFDMQGNVAQRLNAAGNVASSDAYDAFGSRVSTAGGSDVFGYGGQWGYQTDAETGLVLCTHRYYDPGTGRWLTRDPMGYGGGINLYGYTQNNPVNESDPSGLQDVYGGPGDFNFPSPSLNTVLTACEAAYDLWKTGDNHLGPWQDSPYWPGAGREGGRPKRQYPNRYNGPKPPYENPGHHQRGSGFRGGGSRTTPLPEDAEGVYGKTVPDEAGKNWYGRGEDGDIYRYQPGQGGNHWNGREYSPRGLEVPQGVRQRLGPTRPMPRR